MRRKFDCLLFGAALVALAGCKTYQHDLDRATDHYRENRHAQALALLEVLQDDVDSLSTSERTRYAYFRGMTHFRLGKDRASERREARHWLGLAAANEKLYPNSLSKDERERVESTLEELNVDRYGASSPTATSSKPAQPATSAPDTSDAPASKGDAKTTPCALDTDCVRGEYCDAGRCRKATP